MVEDLTNTACGPDMEEFPLTDRTPVSNQPLREAEALERSAADCFVIGDDRPGAEGSSRPCSTLPRRTNFDRATR